jgi:hypothetical protein
MIDIEIDSPRSVLIRMLPSWPDCEPGCTCGCETPTATAPEATAADFRLGGLRGPHVRDAEAMPRMPWVAYVVLPDSEQWTRDAPDVEAFGWLEGPYRADEALISTVGRVRRFSASTPACALVEAQTFLTSHRRTLRSAELRTSR